MIADVQGRVSAGPDDKAIFSRPVMPVAREGPGGPILNEDLGAVAVILDFVQPAIAGGRGLDQAWMHERERLGQHEAGTLLRLESLRCKH